MAILLGVALPAAAQTDARKLGVYFDAEGTMCAGTIRPGTPAEVFIIGKVGGTEGITGATLRFTGAPQTWDLYPVANPLMIAVGNPFGDGALLAFSLLPVFVGGWKRPSLQRAGPGQRGHLGCRTFLWRQECR